MKAVAQDAFLGHGAGQGIEPGKARPVVVEGRVEAGNLRHTRPARLDRPDPGEVEGLVAGGERREALQPLDHLGREQDRRVVVGPAMHHPVSGRMQVERPEAAFEQAQKPQRQLLGVPRIGGRAQFERAVGQAGLQPRLKADPPIRPRTSGRASATSNRPNLTVEEPMFRTSQTGFIRPPASLAAPRHGAGQGPPR